jgi:hypothetical protein
VVKTNVPRFPEKTVPLFVVPIELNVEALGTVGDGGNDGSLLMNPLPIPVVTTALPLLNPKIKASADATDGISRRLVKTRSRSTLRAMTPSARRV